MVKQQPKMDMFKYNWIHVAIALVLIVGHYNALVGGFVANGHDKDGSKRLSIHDPECPRKVEMTSERKCLKKCRSDLDCRGRSKRCLCDDVCGKSCVKPTRRCENLKMIFNGHYSMKPFNTFGAVARYTCNEGYILSGQPERVCQGDGYWSGKAPTCETEGKCRDPPSVPHAKHDGPLGQSVFPLGTQLTYTCSRGYNIDGFFRAMCVGEGRWVGPRMTCSPRRCGHPGDIPHGTREGSIFVYDNRVTYKCNEGYELVGRSFRECLENGAWSNSLPVCLPVKCPRFSDPANGKLEGSDFTYGAVVKFTCRLGFTLIGSPTRRCTQDGTWDGHDASCPMVDCGLPGPFYNGYLDGKLTTFGSIIIYRCFGGTTFSGESKSTTCEENGEWSHAVPTCNSKCEVPKLTNGTVLGHESGARVEHGTRLTLNCSEGFSLNDTTKPDCFNGSWTFIPKCVPASCTERPNDLRNGMVRFYTMRHGDKAKYICETGFKLIGKDYVTCQFGQWDNPGPYCKQIYCDYPGTIANGQVLLVGVIGKYEYRPYVKRIGHNEQIEFHCNKGYKRNGTMAATCVDGQWSPDSMPSCVPGKYPKLMYIFRGKRDTSLVHRESLAIHDNNMGDGMIEANRHKRDTSLVQRETLEDSNVVEWMVEASDTQRTKRDTVENELMNDKNLVDKDGEYDQFNKGFCSVPTIEHGSLVAPAPPPSYLVYHGTTLTIRCWPGYHVATGAVETGTTTTQMEKEGEDGVLMMEGGSQGNVLCNDGIWFPTEPLCLQNSRTI